MGGTRGIYVYGGVHGYTSESELPYTWCACARASLYVYLRVCVCVFEQMSAHHCYCVIVGVIFRGVIIHCSACG